MVEGNGAPLSILCISIGPRFLPWSRILETSTETSSSEAPWKGNLDYGKKLRFPEEILADESQQKHTHIFDIVKISYIYKNKQRKSRIPRRKTQLVSLTLSGCCNHLLSLAHHSQQNQVRESPLCNQETRVAWDNPKASATHDIQHHNHDTHVAQLSWHVTAATRFEPTWNSCLRESRPNKPVKHRMALGVDMDPEKCTMYPNISTLSHSTT